MYHMVTDTKDEPDVLQVSPKQFEAQMLYLKRCNLKGVSVHELLQAISIGKARRLIGVTFDDGHESVLQYALPVLERLGFSATVFVVANWMLEAERFESKCLTIGELREMAKRGIEIGSHSPSHPKLSNISKREVLDLTPFSVPVSMRVWVREITDSREILRETLGKEVLGFSYPYGDRDDRAVQAVQ
jgi:peptidoglycan/xylan/chitin deacetylase (PgdA/CDA1 family)